MNILVISATGTEIEPLLSWLRVPGNSTRDTDILLTGVGLMATSYSLTRQISIKRPDLVIQAGIAGAFRKDIPLGSVLAIQKEVVADLGVMEPGGFKNIFELRLAGSNKPPFTKGWLLNKSGILRQIKLKKATAVSTNEISTSPKKIAAYKAAFDPAVESMEGAALHYVCIKENIPFLQLRAVSNYVGERNKSRWKIKESIINLNKELIYLLETL